MAFLKAHCDVNKELLDQAIAMALFSRKDTSNDVHNPVEVNIIFDHIHINLFVLEYILG